MTRRVLMICYYFPPLGGIGSLRALKFAEYLPEFGWEPTVLTPRDGAYHRDATLQFPETSVVRTPTLELSRVGKQMMSLPGGDTQSVPIEGGLLRLRGFVRRWLYWPDAQIGWYPFAVHCGRRQLREKRFDAIFSSSFPITAHAVARTLSRNGGVPWLAEFRDLWTDLASYDSALRRKRDQAVERAILREATAVVTVSSDWARILRDRGARDVSVVTNGFDPIDLEMAVTPDPPVITYAGTYYPEKQDLRAALLALSDLRSSGALAAFRVRFVGTSSRELRAVCERAGLSDVVEWIGPVPHHEALHLMASSSVLLLAGPSRSSAEHPALRGNIAGKVFEYLGAQRPILYIGARDAEVAELLAGFPGVALVDPGDKTAAAEALPSLLNLRGPVCRGGLQPFTRRALARQIAETLDRISA